MMDPEDRVKGSDWNVGHVTVEGRAIGLGVSSRIPMDVAMNGFERGVVLRTLLLYPRTSRKSSVVGDVLGAEQAIHGVRQAMYVVRPIPFVRVRYVLNNFVVIHRSSYPSVVAD